MKHPKIIIGVILAMAVFVGCASMQPADEREAYIKASRAYNAAGGFYLRQEANISPGAKDAIKLAFASASSALDVWWVALENGDNPIASEIAFDKALDEIIEMLPNIIEVLE